MRTLTIHGKLDARLEEVETPQPGPDQVRLRMAYAGICGSDLHYYYEGANGAFVIEEPLVPGHEVSGTVDMDPSGSLEPGTPVTVHPATFGSCRPGLEGLPHLWPGGAYLGSASTRPHTQGGMREYLVVDRTMVRELPGSLSLRAAALAEPLAVTLHGIRVVGGVAGKSVLVSGSGPIGLLAAAAALAHGASEVVSSDVLAGPLERASALGVTSTVLVREEELAADHFDVVLECSGAVPAVNAAIRAVRPAGVVAQIGMMGAGVHAVELAPLVSKEVQLRGAFRFNDEIDEAVRLLASNASFEQVITHVLPADEAADAFATAKDSERSGKVLVDLWSDDGQPVGAGR